MNSDAKIEKIKVNTNLKNINLNQRINNSSFSSASNSINNINTNVETIDFNNFTSVNANSIYTPHIETKSVFEKTGATGVGVITSLGEGLGLFGEAIIDAGAILSTATNSVTTGIIDGGQALFDVGKGTIKAIKNNDNVFDSIKNEFDNYQSLTISNWKNTQAFVSNEYVKTAFDGFYENNSVGKWISDTSYGFDNVRNVGSGVGYVGGIVAISIATFGIGGAAIGGSAAATTATTSGLSATMAGVAATAGLGKGTQNAWNDGASLGKGLAYGTASAVWEGAQFYAGGQINALNVGSNAIANAGVRVGLDTLTGAAEGFAQPALQKIYKDESYQELFENAGGWKNVGMQGAMAAGMSTFGEVSGLAKKIREINSKIDVDSNIEVIKQLDEVFDNKDFASSMDTLIDRTSDINGRKNASLLLSLLDYDNTPTLVSSEVFDEMTIQSQYGKLYRGISGDNVDLYINELKEGQMYVGGNNAAAYGSGIYTAYGDSYGKIVENYASSGNTQNGKIVEMLLSDEAKIVDFDIINSEKEKVLDSISKRFNKYNKEIVDFNSLTLNIDSITDETDKKIALYLQKTLNDTGLYASLRGYDAINIPNKEYIVVLNRGKVIMKNANINNNGLLDVKNLPLSSNKEIRSVQEKILNNEPLSLNERLKVRDSAVTKINDVDLYSDHMYRATSYDALTDYIKNNAIRDNGLGKGYSEVNWYLGGTAKRYGKVVIETPADPNLFKLSDDYGGFLSGNPNVRQAHSSNIDPVSFDKISRIIFLDDTGENVLKVVDPKSCTDLMNEVETGNLLYQQNHLLKAKNKLGDKFTPEMQNQLDEINLKLNNN